MKVNIGSSRLFWVVVIILHFHPKTFFKQGVYMSNKRFINIFNHYFHNDIPRKGRYDLLLTQGIAEYLTLTLKGEDRKKVNKNLNKHWNDFIITPVVDLEGKQYLYYGYDQCVIWDKETTSIKFTELSIVNYHPSCLIRNSDGTVTLPLTLKLRSTTAGGQLYYMDDDHPEIKDNYSFDFDLSFDAGKFFKDTQSGSIYKEFNDGEIFKILDIIFNSAVNLQTYLNKIYLLGKIEEHEGISACTTRYRSSINWCNLESEKARLYWYPLGLFRPESEITSVLSIDESYNDHKPIALFKPIDKELKPRLANKKLYHHRTMEGVKADLAEIAYYFPYHVTDGVFRTKDRTPLSDLYHLNFEYLDKIEKVVNHGMSTYISELHFANTVIFDMAYGRWDDKERLQLKGMYRCIYPSRAFELRLAIVDQEELTLHNYFNYLDDRYTIAATGIYLDLTLSPESMVFLKEAKLTKDLPLQVVNTLREILVKSVNGDAERYNPEIDHQERIHQNFFNKHVLTTEPDLWESRDFKHFLLREESTTQCG